MQMLPTYYIVVYEPCYAFVLCIDEAFVLHVFNQDPKDLQRDTEFQIETAMKKALLQAYNANRTQLVELFTGSISICPNNWQPSTVGKSKEAVTVLMDAEAFRFKRVQPLQEQHASIQLEEQHASIQLEHAATVDSGQQHSEKQVRKLRVYEGKDMCE